MKPLDDAARDVLRAGKQAEGPGPADRARVRQKLELALAAGVIGPAIAPPAGAAKAWWASKLWWGSATGGAVVAAAAVAFTLGTRPAATSEAPLAELPGVVAEAPPSPSPPPPIPEPELDLNESDGVDDATPAPAPRPPRRPKKTHAAPHADPVALAAPPAPSPAPPEARRDEDTLEAEAQALHEVQAALRDRDSPRALRLIAEQNARFPHGQLGPEREAARVLALCASDPASGSAALSKFVAAHPGSPLLGRLKAACAK